MQQDKPIIDEEVTQLGVESSKNKAEEKKNQILVQEALRELTAKYGHLGKHHNQKGLKYPEILRVRRDKFKGTGWRSKNGAVNRPSDD
jgi:hypothetical protein